jgi:hypothetical protein
MPSVIIKNTDSVEHSWGGIIIAATSQYSMQEVDRIRFQSDEAFLTDLASGLAVVNNGEDDLVPDQGLLHLHNKLIFIHDDMDLYPGVGENAAAAKRVSAAVAGFEFKIGDEMFTQARLDDIVGDEVEFESHWCINNAVADRWVAFEVGLISTSGGGDKVMTTPDVVATAGPFLVPTTPNQIFRFSGTLPSSYFQNGEKYIYFGIKRIDVVPLGKTNPTNNPVLFRICKIYTRSLEE